MPNLYARCIDRWERWLAQRDADRPGLPFDWGLDWIGCEPATDPRSCLKQYSDAAVANSESFFTAARPADFDLAGGALTFSSPLASPHSENSRVWADYFPVKGSRGRAVLVLPQWNADAGGHVALCRLLNRCGVAALRMSLAYHDRRRPAGQRRADYHVSPNIGRTIHASRQSVLDARACLDWLESEGYNRLGILGTSLGSCIAYITAAHDARIRAGVFNHVSLYFGDVVWTGLATRHVRQGFGQAVTQDELRQYWTPISPAAYLDRLTGRAIESLLIWARHDTTFLPEYSRRFIEASRLRGHRTRAVSLPCAHYTTGAFPFNLMDAFLICRFLRERL